MLHLNSVAKLSLCQVALTTLLVAQLPITPGDIVVLRVGDATLPLSSAAQATFLDEYTQTGVLVQSIPVPTVVNGINLPCTNSGTSTSEGHLNVSPDGSFFTFGGYSAAPGTAGITASASITVPRVIARVDNLGYVDTSTSINNAFSAGNIRSVATDNGVQFWASGSNSGVQYSTYFTSTSTSASTGLPTNLRDLGIYNGQLYCSSGSGAFQGVCSVGIGLPTAPTTITLLPGFPTVSGAQSTYDWFFSDPNTCYVTSDSAIGGGIQKWTFLAGTWTLAYTLVPTGTLTRYLSGMVQNGVVTLYATTTQTSANTIVSVVDAGVGSTFTVIASAVPNTVLRGIRIAGPRGYVSYSGTGSPTTFGIPTIYTLGGLPNIGNASFALASGNMPAFSIGFMVIGLGNLLPFGIPIPGAAATAFLYVNPIASTNLLITDATGAATIAFGLPLLPGFVGIQLGAQTIAFDPLLPDPLPLGTSSGMQVTIGQ